MGAGNLQEVPVMKPQFANVFNVSVNDNRSECSLSFYHMYMQHNYTPQPKGLIDMPEKTVGEVASIMLTREGRTRSRACSSRASACRRRTHERGADAPPRPLPALQGEGI